LAVEIVAIPATHLEQQEVGPSRTDLALFPLPERDSMEEAVGQQTCLGSSAPNPAQVVTVPARDRMEEADSQV
tara:strand:+ start:5680 stop:5898 length:219 start_codon:yes stop_codon:yes gene_type:complete